MAQRKELKKIKSTFFERSASLAQLTFKSGVNLAGYTVTQFFKSNESRQELWKKFLLSQASNLTSELGELKGSLMKAGQLFSMLGEQFLPTEVNQILKSLQSDSPPLQWEQIEKYLKMYLTTEQLSQLDIEKVALASASLGQVHCATIIKTQEKIVLKIQYPGVAKAIDNDLKALKFFLNMAKLLPKDYPTEPIFLEIREMLTQEVDYIQEAKMTDFFFDKLKHDKRFIVPKVYHAFSNEKILATSFEEGVRVDDIKIHNLDQERRNNLAKNYLDLFFLELFDWKVVQTDPHFGNYKIRLGDASNNENKLDQLVLLDFGATRSYDDAFLHPYFDMLQGAIYNQEELFMKAVHKLKFIRNNDPDELIRLFKDLCDTIVEPYLDPHDPRNKPTAVQADGSYDWKNSDLPKRLSRQVLQIIQKFYLRSPPREILFLDRKTGGVFIFLSVLRAQINGRSLIKKYLPEVL